MRKSRTRQFLDSSAGILRRQEKSGLVSYGLLTCLLVIHKSITPVEIKSTILLLLYVREISEDAQETGYIIFCSAVLLRKKLIHKTSRWLNQRQLLRTSKVYVTPSWVGMCVPGWKSQSENTKPHCLKTLTKAIHKWFGIWAFKQPTSDAWCLRVCIELDHVVRQTAII